MLDLYVMRHAKSSWKDATLDDFHRPLNKRGRKAVPVIAAWMKAHDIKPQLVLVSGAERTRETWKLLRRDGIKAKHKRVMQRLYHASSGEVFKVVKEIEEPVERVLILGHNPGLQIFLKQLVSLVSDGAGGSFYRKYPTAAVAHVKLDVSGWSDVAPHQGTLYRYATPKALRGQDI